jgi:cholesterol transport system auxiliary component
MSATRRMVLLASAGAWLAGCSAIPDKPVRATQYDFGPGSTAAAAAPSKLTPLVLGEVEASNALDGTEVLYRLGYADPHQLQPYARARWSAPMPQLIRQRLRERLARERVVLDLSDSTALARAAGVLPRVLRLQLEEFSQVFDTPGESAGLLRLRATLTENTVAGERLIAQRSVVARRPAPSADAPGGVRALAAATDAAADEIALWLQEQP